MKRNHCWIIIKQLPVLQKARSQKQWKLKKLQRPRKIQRRVYLVTMRQQLPLLEKKSHCLKRLTRTINCLVMLTQRKRPLLLQWSLPRKQCTMNYLLVRNQHRGRGVGHCLTKNLMKMVNCLKLQRSLRRKMRAWKLWISASRQVRH